MAEVGRIKRVAVDKLIPYINNAKEHPEEQVMKIASSIREFGFLNPVLIDKEFNIIAGHGRVMAAKKLEMKEVPCLDVDGLSEAQRKAYILADNRLGELADWNMELVTSELEMLQDLDFDIDLTGFELPKEEPEVEVVEDEVPEEVETRCKLGDLWQLGDHRLICGDCTDVNVIDRLLGGIKVDMVFTDPPWNVNYGAVQKGNPQGYKPRTIKNDFMPTEDFKDFMSSTFASMNIASKEGAMTYVVMSAQEWGNLMLTLVENGYHWSSTIIWNKDRLVLSRKDYHTKYEPIWYGWKEGEARLHPLKDRKQCDVWDFERPSTSDEHPTMKPVGLVARAITNSSDSGDAVLDLFGGSGTTLIASEQTGRHCYMSELDEHYCDVIITRWENLTGKTAKLLK